MGADLSGDSSDLVRRAVESAAKRDLGHGLRVQLRQQLDDLVATLHNGEEPIILVGTYGGNAYGLLAVTVDRLLFISDGGPLETVDFDSANVTARSGPGDSYIGEVTVNAGSRTLRFTDFDGITRAQEVAALINGDAPAVDGQPEASEPAVFAALAAAARSDVGHESIAIDVGTWTPAERGTLAAELARYRVRHSWSGSDVVVSGAVEDAVRAAMVEIRGGAVADVEFDDGVPEGQLRYDLEQWSADQIADLAGVLAREGIGARWEDSDLYVQLADEARTDQLTEWIRQAVSPTDQHGARGTASRVTPVARVGTNGLAIASLVLGVLWIWWLGSLLAVIFGHFARRQIRETGAGGDGLAVAGLILGWIGLAVLGVLVVGLLSASG
jgi:hypothetical protein